MHWFGMSFDPTVKKKLAAAFHCTLVNVGFIH